MGLFHPSLRSRRLATSVSLLLLVLLAGCFPSSCRRTESRAISPTDSLSRTIAAGIAPDTLEVAWQTPGPEETPLTYPRTVRFAPNGQLLVSDAERGSIFVFTDAGEPVREISWDGLGIPYLAGVRADTLFVFDPEARRLHAVVDGTPVYSIPTPDDLPEGPLQYAAVDDEAFYVKVVGQDFEGYLARIDASGTVVERRPLPGPHWRYAGLLRPWGDSLLSLCGFRPVVDVLTPEGRLDSLALLGFDSPMLSRSYAFLLGETHEAPLLSPSAAVAGDMLFVLNLRPGWIRVDVYDRSGRLQHVLVEPHPDYNRQFYPMDLAVRARADGGYDLAVVQVEPQPRLAVFRWSGLGPATASRPAGSSG